MHRAGLVHRDITPANLFLVDGGETMDVRILDLGIAKLESHSDLTTTGTAIGSPVYMSPEQARAEPVDRQSDLWSLGAVLFRCITGRDAFVGSSTADLLVLVCTLDPTPVETLRPELPRSLNSFFRQALSRRRELRFQSAQELARAFEAAVATPSPPSSRPGRSIRLLVPGAALLGAAGTFALMASQGAPQAKEAPDCPQATLSATCPELAPPPVHREEEHGADLSPSEPESARTASPRSPSRAPAPPRALAPNPKSGGEDQAKPKSEPSGEPRPAERLDPLFGLPTRTPTAPEPR